MTGSRRERLQEVALRVLADRERLGYPELAARARKRDVEAFDDGEGTDTVQIEVQYFFDSGQTGPIRIAVSVDGGGWSTLTPLTQDTIVAGPSDA